MSIRNYFSKTLFILKAGANFKSIFNLILNSKKYSYYFKNNLLKEKNKIVSTNYNFRLYDKSFTLKLRNYSGDIDIFYEVFWKKIYNLPEESLKNPKVIIDAGAHVGMTSIYFALKYPKSKIIAIEPSKENFELLQYNTKIFSNINCLNAAVNTVDCRVNIINADLSYNIKMGEGNDNVVDGFNLTTIMEMYKLEKIDLIKIDIEGAEKDLLKSNNDWLDKIINLLIEIHHPYNEKELIVDLIDFQIITKKEVYYLKKKDYIWRLT